MATIKVNDITFYPIPDFATYYVSLCSKIYRSATHKYPNGLIHGTIISQTGNGYHQAQLFKDGKRYHKLIHRLLAEMFIPNPENLPFVDHKNKNSMDNRLKNLRWVTHKENAANATKYKNKNKGTFWQGVTYENNAKSGKRFAKGRVRAFWCDENNKNRGASFSVNKYGMMALVCAIDKRNEMVDKLYNRYEEIYAF